MLELLAHLRKPTSKRDVRRLVVVYTAISVVVSAAVTYGFTTFNGLPLGNSLIPAVVIPLLVAPWMTSTIANYALQLHEMRLELERLARVDPLSGALNRRGLAQLAERAFETRQEAGDVSVIVMDIDRFKSVNDNYGHSAGDTVIARVVEIAKQIGGVGGAVARLGGDELVVLFSGLDLEDTLLVAERLRDAIEHTIFIHGDRALRVTSSIGVAVSDAQDRNIESLLTRADKSLYEAKMAGRNRVRAAA